MRIEIHLGYALYLECIRKDLQDQALDVLIAGPDSALRCLLADFRENNNQASFSEFHKFAIDAAIIVQEFFLPEM